MLRNLENKIIEVAYNKHKTSYYFLLKENEELLGYIYLNQISEGVYDVPTIGCKKGYGALMHIIALKYYHPYNGIKTIIPYRRKFISKNLKQCYLKLLENKYILNKKITRFDKEFEEFITQDEWFNNYYSLNNDNLNKDLENSKLSLSYKIRTDTLNVRNEGLKFFISLYDSKNIYENLVH